MCPSCKTNKCPVRLNYRTVFDLFEVLCYYKANLDIHLILCYRMDTMTTTHEENTDERIPMDGEEIILPTFTKQDILDFFDDLPEKMKDSLREPFGLFLMMSDYVEKMPYFLRNLAAGVLGRQVIAVYKRFGRDSVKVREIVTWMFGGLFYLPSDWESPWDEHPPDDEVGAIKTVPLRQPDYPLPRRRTRDDF